MDANIHRIWSSDKGRTWNHLNSNQIRGNERNLNKAIEIKEGKTPQFSHNSKLLEPKNEITDIGESGSNSEIGFINERHRSVTRKEQSGVLTPHTLRPSLLRYLSQETEETKRLSNSSLDRSVSLFAIKEKSSIKEQVGWSPATPVGPPHQKRLNGIGLGTRNLSELPPKGGYNSVSVQPNSVDSKNCKVTTKTASGSLSVTLRVNLM